MRIEFEADVTVVETMHHPDGGCCDQVIICGGAEIHPDIWRALGLGYQDMPEPAKGQIVATKEMLFLIDASEVALTATGVSVRVGGIDITKFLNAASPQALRDLMVDLKGMISGWAAEIDIPDREEAA